MVKQQKNREAIVPHFKNLYFFCHEHHRAIHFQGDFYASIHRLRKDESCNQ